MSGAELDVLVVDDEPTQRRMLVDYLAQKGYDLREAGSAEEALQLLGARAPDVVLTDLRLPGADGLEFLRRVRERRGDAEFLIMTAFGTVENAVEAMRAGAYDYLTKPVRLDELDQLLARIVQKRNLIAENRELRHRLRETDDLAGLGRAMSKVRELADRVALSEATVLITGESGTGKEIVANRLHRMGRRAGAAFVKINCAALPEGLLEAELFGHEKGAFTGADTMRRGLFEAAHKGTILLDEIGDVSPSLQVRLLRVVQERRVMRVGGRAPIDVDIRLLVATHRDLGQLVSAGTFREDLYFRLNVIEIHIPPLRERIEDIPILAERLLRRHAARNAVPYRMLTTEALAALVRHPFPGNVRELENLLERALILARGDHIGPADFPPTVAASSASEGGAPQTLTEAIAALERAWIRRALADSDGVRARAARHLGIPDRVLRYKMRKYAIDKSDSFVGDEG